MFWRVSRRGVAVLAGLAVATMPNHGLADSPPVVVPDLAYADLVDLAESAPAILRAVVRKVAVVEPQRAGNVRPGYARIYVEAVPDFVLGGAIPPGQTIGLVRYLADVPADAKGHIPDLKRSTVILFTRLDPVDPGLAQLIAPDAQIVADDAMEKRVVGVIGQLQAADVPPRLNGVREAIYVPGNLAGEGETQIFLATAGGTPASISVVHAPGEARPHWSVSFSEVMDASGLPPEHDTLAWYRLACFLPDALPDGTNVSETQPDRDRAAADYAFLRGALGPCGRKRS